MKAVELLENINFINSNLSTDDNGNVYQASQIYHEREVFYLSEPFP